VTAVIGLAAAIGYVYAPRNRLRGRRAGQQGQT